MEGGAGSRVASFWRACFVPKQKMGIVWGFEGTQLSPPAPPRPAAACRPLRTSGTACRTPTCTESLWRCSAGRCRTGCCTRVGRGPAAQGVAAWWPSKLHLARQGAGRAGCRQGCRAQWTERFLLLMPASSGCFNPLHAPPSAPQPHLQAPPPATSSSSTCRPSRPWRTSTPPAPSWRPWAAPSAPTCASAATPSAAWSPC